MKISRTNVRSFPDKAGLAEFEASLAESQRNILRSRLEDTLERLSIIHGDLLDTLRLNQRNLGNVPVNYWLSSSERTKLLRFHRALASLAENLGNLTQTRLFWQREKKQYIVRQKAEQSYLTASRTTHGRLKWEWTSDKTKVYAFPSREAAYYRIHHLCIPDEHGIPTEWMINAVDIEGVQPDTAGPQLVILSTRTPTDSLSA